MGSKTVTGTIQLVSKLKAFIHTKIFSFMIVLLIGFIGYTIAPADLQVGQYTSSIMVTFPSQTLAADYNFELNGVSGELIQVEQSSGWYTLQVEGAESFHYGIGEQISYRLRVIDTRGNPIDLSLEAASSTVTDDAGYSQVLPPTGRDGEWITFSMRIPYKAKIVTGLLFAVATLWLLETIPLAAASLLIPVVVVLAGVTDASTVLSPFFHPIIVLFLAGFLMAEAMRRTGTDRLIALTILKYSSSRPALLMLTMMSLTAVLSMWMSNTASVAIIIPIALAILSKLPDDEESSRFRRALVLGVAYAGAVGGIGSAIGTPANILAMTFLSEYAGEALTFTDWFAYGLPIVVIMVPIIWVYLMLSFKVKGIKHRPTLDADETGGLKDITHQQVLIGVIFIITIGLWLSESFHHIPSAIVALMGALALFFFGQIEEEDFNRINWNALITFGGGLSIGSMLVLTGVSDWIALQLIGLAVLPPVLVIFLVATLTLVLGAFVSNTATAAMLIPLAIPLARILHLDPRLLVAVVAIGSSIDFALVIGTPPTMLAYSTGIFDGTREIAKRGIVLDFIGLLILSFGVIWIWDFLGVVSLF